MNKANTISNSVKAILTYEFEERLLGFSDASGLARIGFFPCSKEDQIKYNRNRPNKRFYIWADHPVQGPEWLTEPYTIPVFETKLENESAYWRLGEEVLSWGEEVLEVLMSQIKNNQISLDPWNLEPKNTELKEWFLAKIKKNMSFIFIAQAIVSNPFSGMYEEFFSEFGEGFTEKSDNPLTYFQAAKGLKSLVNDLYLELEDIKFNPLKPIQWVDGVQFHDSAIIGEVFGNNNRVPNYREIHQTLWQQIFVAYRGMVREDLFENKENRKKYQSKG